MTVYVDNMRAKFGRMIMCHMIADTEDELHALAQKIGIARRWYQGDHYDIALSKRALAVENGAVEITMRQCGCMNMRRRATGTLGSPSDAEAWARQQIRDRRQANTPVAHPIHTVEAARLAIAEYNAAYEQGGELEYPMWAEAILKRAESTRKEAA